MNKKTLKYLTFILCFILIICFAILINIFNYSSPINSIKQTKENNTAKQEIILQAQLLKWKSLPIKVRHDLNNCSYSKGWNNREYFSCKSAFYLELKIDNEKLAKGTSEALINDSDYMTTDYILNGPKDYKGDYQIGNKEKCSWSYGKYKNRFEVDASIPETNKSGGFSIHFCSRKENIDTIIIGDFIKIPSKIIINANGQKLTEEIVKR